MAEFNDTQFIRLPEGRGQANEETLDAATVLAKVYDGLREKGYNPVSQIVGYIMSGDPTYITNHKNARALIMKVERDDLLTELVEHYIRTLL